AAQPAFFRTRSTKDRVLGALTAIAFALPLLALFAVSTAAQTEHNDFPVETPSSTHEGPKDRGARAHTNHFILFRPDRTSQAVARIPVGETPGSLACVYQTSTASLSTGCPITGNLSSGNNGLPNPVGGSQTIAIVDAYDYPTAYNDLTVFSNQFGLPVLP